MSEMCYLHLTHPSGAVGSRHCGARGAVGGSVPCSRVSPQSWTLPARAMIRTHNLGLPWVSSPTLYPLGHDCPYSLSMRVCEHSQRLLALCYVPPDGKSRGRRSNIIRNKPGQKKTGSQIKVQTEKCITIWAKENQHKTIFLRRNQQANKVKQQYTQANW